MAVAVWSELRTAVAGIDPGMERLRLATIGSASMALAVVVMGGVRALTGQPVTLVIFAAVLAMISNLAVNESDLQRRRVTTVLMALPAAVAVVAGTLLSPHRVIADVVFVGVTAAAVYVRRFGPRGTALGMALFMPYFFTQFLQARPAELPYLLLAAAAGLGSTLLLRGYLFAEREERTLARLLRAFRAHVHGVVVAVAALLTASGGPADRVERARRDTRRRRARLNTTALLVADRLDRLTADEGQPAAVARAEALEQRMLDVELAAERLAIATRRLTEVGGPRGDEREVLLAGLRGLGAATATGTPRAMVPSLLDEARHSVAEITTQTGDGGERTQRVAFAVHRLADTLGTTTGPDDLPGAPAPEANTPDADSPAPGAPDADSPAGTPAPTAPVDGTPEEAATTPDPPHILRLSTRQALQAAVAVGLSIVVGELVSPARWYWAAVAAFVVFTQTNSRGDIVSRGWQRILGTVGGVAAGMGLGLLVGDRVALAVPALVVCLFLALYLVRISQALMAFWLTAVLALMYGLIGQFSLATLVLRIEETVAGALMGVLAAFVVLPRRTRDAYTEARADLVRRVDGVLAAATDRLLGRVPAEEPVDLARDMDAALSTLRDRTGPLTVPGRRTTTRYRDTLHVLAGVDHYARALARLSDTVHAPDWAPLLEPAVERVRANLGALCDVPAGGGGTAAGRASGTAAGRASEAAAGRASEAAAGRASGTASGRPRRVTSADDLVDAAEAWAARHRDGDRRHELLEVARLVRRIDQSVLTLVGAPVAPELSRR